MARHMDNSRTITGAFQTLINEQCSDGFTNLGITGNSGKSDVEIAVTLVKRDANRRSIRCSDKNWVTVSKNTIVVWLNETAVGTNSFPGITA